MRRLPMHQPQRVADMPVPTTSAPVAAQVAAPISEEESNTEVLSLVYAYVSPGSRRSVQEILKPEIESTTTSPWVIVRVDPHMTLVSFRPYSEALETAPAYEFVVDTLAKTVIASPETIQNLRGNALAAR